MKFFNTWMCRTGLVLTGVTLFIAVSAYVNLPFWELAFRSDKSPLSWLSSTLLFACAMLMLQIGTQRGLSFLLSTWLTLSLLVLSLDEQFMYHEYWKYHCAKLLDRCAQPAAGHVDWLGDAPMAMVGCIGMASFAILYRAVDSAVVKRLILASISVGVVLALGTHFGHAVGILPAWFNRFEEVFEVLAESLFVCALLEIRPAHYAPH